MRWDIDDLDGWLRRALLLPIAAILYAGPASALALDRFLSEEFGRETSQSGLGAWLPWILVVWIAAVPIFLGFRYWDDSPTASAAWLGVFLGVALLPALAGFVFLYNLAAALVILPAIVVPFQWIDVDMPSARVDVATVAARVVTWTLFFVIPLGALIVQLLQLRGQPSR